MCLKVIKRVKNYHENTSLGMDVQAKHVEKYDSTTCGLIDSKGRKQKTIVINESGHVDKDEKGVNKSFTLYPLKEEGEVFSKHPQVKLMMNAQKSLHFPISQTTKRLISQTTKRLISQSPKRPISQTPKRPND